MDSACDAAILELSIPRLPASASVLASANLTRGLLLRLAQLDRAQLTGVAVLQLLRCEATQADGGTLVLHHGDDGPEVRFVASGPSGAGVTLAATTLPAPCGSHSAADSAPASRLLDYRCHSPGGRLGRAFGRGLSRCLVALGRGGALPTMQLLGAQTAERRAATARLANRLLQRGMEAALASTLGAERGGRVASPCCSMAACGAEALRPRSAPAAEPAADDGNGGLPRHPLPLGRLEDWAAAAEGALRNGSLLSRPPGALAAEVAARLLEDGSAWLPDAFDPRFANPCWRCRRTATAPPPRPQEAVRAAATPPHVATTPPYAATTAQAAATPPAASAAAAPTSSPGAELCCLPYAHILGVSKCGTTDLHARLARHPLLLPSANKGPHFWDEPHTLAWYVDLFARGAARLAAGAAPRSSVMVDASSNTLSYTGVGVRGTLHPASPPVTIPQVMGWLQPAARLLVMLREPAARYYSAYHYYNRRYAIYERYGPTGPAAFDKMVQVDVSAFRRCRSSGATVRRCARQTFYEAQQLVKGVYAPFLEPWLASFPPTSLLVLRLEDYEASLAAHLAAVLDFLRMPRPPRAAWRLMLAQPRANRRVGRGEPMLNGTRVLLRDFYAEHNERLATMLGDARYLRWNVE